MRLAVRVTESPDLAMVAATVADIYDLRHDDVLDALQTARREGEYIADDERGFRLIYRVSLRGESGDLPVYTVNVEDGGDIARIRNTAGAIVALYSDVAGVVHDRMSGRELPADSLAHARFLARSEFGHDI